MQQHDLTKAATALRMLAVSAIEKAKSGHPGMPLGFADVFTVLAAKFLKFYPHDLRCPVRDRLILSAGHGSMLLYAFYYLAGFKDFTLEDIKNFRQLSSKTPGHPEYGIYPAIETTTGPLGQGFANAVGMAIAGKKYKQELNLDYKIYCIVGDGCLMEGISYEAASLAGHLQLNNLIVLFDDNQITIDGPTKLAISENQLLKFQSLGWQTIAIDGHDMHAIEQALSDAQTAKKPVLIACKTIIGYGSDKSGSADSHGSALGAKSFAQLKISLNWPYDDFIIPAEYMHIWQSFAQRNQASYLTWQNNLTQLNQKEKSYLAPFNFTQETIKQIKQLNFSQDQASRSAVGKIVEIIAQNEQKVIIGSADLSASVGFSSNIYTTICKDDFSGNFLHYGTREHAMGAIMNGLALEGFLPIGGTFLVFSDYMRPSIRLSSLMGLKVLYIMTHDSIGVGEDGPTHQPVEHLSCLRSIPRLTVARPADGVEAVGIFEHIANNFNKPLLLALSRQVLKQTALTDSSLTQKGAYFLNQQKQTDLAIYSTGSELAIAQEVSEILKANNIKADLISVPSIEIFFTQEQEYTASLLAANFKIIIEAGNKSSWHAFMHPKYMFFGVEDFGFSAPGSVVYNAFGLSAAAIASKIIKKYENRN